MKPYILAVLLCSAYFASGQSWCPAGANWTYETSSVSGGGFTHAQYEKDTVINGQNCKKLQVYAEEDATVPGPPFAHFTYESNDTVYFFVNGSFAPTYYFDAALGDTLEMPLINQPCGNVIKVVVDSTATMQVQGQGLRYYRATFNDGTNPASSLHVVERFGVINQNMIPYGFCEGFLSTYEYELACYQDAQISRYQVTPGLTCRYYFPVGILEHDAINASVTLSPNPTQSLLQINITEGAIKEYEIFDVTGKRLVGKTVDGSNITIEVGNLSPGIYLVKLETDSGQFALKRFAKE